MSHKSLDLYFQEIRDLNNKLIKTMGSICRADNGSMYQMDLLSCAVVNRSLELSKGFESMITSDLFLCAAPLLRLQLDNLLRYSALWLVENPDAVCGDVLGGKPIRKIKDKSGIKMTDAHLVSVLSKNVKWISTVYEKTCGYIHFSESHFNKTLLSVNDDGKVEIGIGNRARPVPKESLEEACAAYKAITFELLSYLEGWLKEKQSYETRS
ncbi:hypothetical protein C0W80_16055 [Photobacterium leiognathi subsp. mandapamensis]|uniref:hypothetical protein n=1 Tax=Photobacterium leiognathi TaxID=553611 RepID=UPI000D1623BE|nr:hypothetical protein [Photobacterium leiognathi]PSU97838.1 hypothetical protein C0W80_16055 [Photobacterium leiognathi subsp. mandapamensis]